METLRSSEVRSPLLPWSSVLTWIKTFGYCSRGRLDSPQRIFNLISSFTNQKGDLDSDNCFSGTADHLSRPKDLVWSRSFVQILISNNLVMRVEPS